MQAKPDADTLQLVLAKLSLPKPDSLLWLPVDPVRLNPKSCQINARVRCGEKVLSTERRGDKLQPLDGTLVALSILVAYSLRELKNLLHCSAI